MQRNAPRDATAWCAHTRQEAAAILRVPVGQIDAAIQSGALDHFRMGKHIRIADSSLRRFAGQEPAAAAA